MEIDRLKRLTPNALVSEAAARSGVERLQFFLSSDEVRREVPAHFLDLVTGSASGSY